MSWEGIAAIATALGLLITIIGGGFSVSYFFGKVISRFDSLIKDFTSFTTNFKEHMSKEDSTHSAMWGKIDNHAEKLVEHHHRISFFEKKDD